MGTLASSLIQSAYREGNLIPVGKQPTSDELTEALPRLNIFVQGVYGFELGENLSDWLVPPMQRTSPTNSRYPQAPLCSPLNLGPSAVISQNPPSNVRLIFGGVDYTVYFPQHPEDGARMALVQGSGAGDGLQAGSTLVLDGNGRLIQDPADSTYKDTVSLTTPVTAQQWLYRADLATWILVVDMALTDECPFPEEFDDFWICALAKRLAPRYNKITAAETQETAQQTLARIKARYRQSQITTYGSDNFPRTDQSYLGGQWWW
jgi:hypothetical protein